MKILSLDTSGAVASAAVMEDGLLMGEYSINSKTTHSQRLMPMVGDLLKSLSLEPSDIDVFAVAIGPGSFTGLRIGISIVKGMAHSVNKPVVGVPTLEGLAYNLTAASGLICPIIDARNDFVYTALFSFSSEDKSLQVINDSTVLHIDELIDMQNGKGQITFLGDGVLKYQSLIVQRLGQNAVFAPGHLLLQKAGSVGFAGYTAYISGQKDSYLSIKPIYIRPSQAERLFNNKDTII